MYEYPGVNSIGKVDDVVLGIASLGTDIDGTMLIGDFDYRQDGDDDDLCTP